MLFIKQLTISLYPAPQTKCSQSTVFKFPDVVTEAAGSSGYHSRDTGTFQ